MSFSEKDRKLQSKSGRSFHASGENGSFAEAIAAALKAEFGATPAALKTVSQLTRSNERAVRNWFDGKNGPSGENLVILMRHSDLVLRTMLTWPEVDADQSCLRLRDSKEGASVRPIGLPVLELLDRRRPRLAAGPVFPGTIEGKPLIGFPKHWHKILAGSPLAGVTPHVLRHSFASLANDLGFTESTVAALLGHAQGTITSRYIHTVDTALIMAADTITGYIQGLLDGVQFKRASYAVDRQSRRAAMDRLFAEAMQPAAPQVDRLAA